MKIQVGHSAYVLISDAGPRCMRDSKHLNKHKNVRQTAVTAQNPRPNIGPPINPDVVRSSLLGGSSATVDVN